MKNQYFGDVNDFRKYGLLRVLQKASGLAIGVCWCLTTADGGADGEQRNYLRHPKRWRHYDPSLYDALQRLERNGLQRSVALARAWELVPGASYFEDLLTDDRVARAVYFSNARQALGDCEVIFVDPDNGIEVQSTKSGTSGSCKYVYWHELQALYADRKSILVYQHFPRVARDRFIPSFAGRLTEQLPGATVTAFSTAYVAFFLVQQPTHITALASVAQNMREQWGGQIELWRSPALGQPGSGVSQQTVRDEATRLPD